MSYSSLDNEGAKLALDDEAGVSFLYPEPGESQQVEALTGCGAIGTGTGNTAGVYLLLSLPLVLVFASRSRRWRKYV